MRAKTITRVIRVSRRRFSEGLSTVQLQGQHLPEHLDPFLAFDHFQMSEPSFPPHPHAGFSAVTYLFEDSEGGLINRDSLGDRSEIAPGELHWTTAGRGLLHEEGPKLRGTPCNGLQLSVNLASIDKFTEPRSQHLATKDVPLFDQEGTRVRVLVGSWSGLTSPLLPPTPVTLLDVHLEQGAFFQAEVPEGESRFVYVVSGAGEFGPFDDVVPIHALQAGGFSPRGQLLQVRAMNSPLHVVIAGGRPLREPTMFHGPFCMNTPEQLQRALLDYQEGRMGHLEPSS
ncbi:MAG: pirin family protein [Myxococcaceae bacterium]|nr:pirin family protein [Myxococcaceae bacterium]